MKIQDREKRKYEAVGRVAGKYQDKVYQTGEKIFCLQVKIENNEKIKEIRAYETKTNKEVWQKIENSDYIGKRYLFIYDKISTAYRLRD
jgi:hypothetical protein